MAGEFPADGMALTVLLVVSDLGRSVAFYRDVLGATLYRAGADGKASIRPLWSSRGRPTDRPLSPLDPGPPGPGQSWSRRYSFIRFG